MLEEIGARSEAWMLERKASVGPCYRSGLPFEGPSGISINLPKKSLRPVTQPSGISINISRRCSTRSKLNINDATKPSELNSEKDKCEPNLTSCISHIRDKIRIVHSKIKTVFQ